MGFRGRGNLTYHRRPMGGRRGNRGRSFTPPTPSPPLGEVLAKIERHDLEDCTAESDPPVQITNTQYLTSYNWLSKGKFEVIVPGEPPAWAPLSKPTQLRADSGIYFRDLNSAYHPTYPLEPMIRAILMDKPDFCVQDLDIVACGSTLGNLLRFARGNSPSFRMLVEVVENTVFFSRRENSPKETIQGIQGFGHTFSEAYTTWSEAVRKSESHQRLINFDFANINCLVRFEADGYLPDLTPQHMQTQKDHISSKSNMEPEDLISSMKAATISKIDPAATEQDPSILKISKGGNHIPQCAIFDLKTRASWKADIDTLSEEMGRLWIRQIPNFVLAYHKSGKFEDIRVRDVRDEMKQWEESQQPVLRRLAFLLETIISFARSTEVERLELEHDEDEKFLSIRVPGGIVGSVLPPDLTENWSQGGSDSES